MRWIADISIRWKLVFATVLTSALALLFSGIVMAWHDGETFKTQKLQEVSVTARIVASAVAPSLDFGDAKATQEYLDAVKANPEIVAAGIYGADGALVTGYFLTRTDPLPGKAQPAAARFEGNELTGFAPIMEG